jgi:glutaminase
MRDTHTNKTNSDGRDHSLMDATRLDYSPLQQYLEALHRNLRDCAEGEVASYIPELLRADPDWFGIAIATVDGHVYQVGDTQQTFTIQSISKAFVYGLALEDNGLDAAATRVDVEPSGEAFNSISLRPDTGRPLNPMINAGAIATAAMVEGDEPEIKLERILASFARYTGHPLTINEDVFRSEKETGHRNRAIAHLLRGFGILDDPPEGILDIYFQQCSIEVTCRDLAVMGACLANNGVNPITAVRALKTDYVPKVLSVMGTCGMYDYSGNWVYTVGMPAKSGVGGGIVAVLPGQLGLAVFSPRLDERGNSARGIKVCEQISADFGLHLYHSVRATTATVIRVAYDGSQVHSKKLRRQKDLEFLETTGRAIRVFELQGDLMFGSTESVLKQVLDSLPACDWFILDLKHVFEIDRAAGQLLRKLKEVIWAQGKILLFTHTADKYGFTRYLRQHLKGQDHRHLFAFADTDHALQWCEDRLLAQRDGGETQTAPVELADQELCQGLDKDDLEELQAIARQVSYTPGETIFHCGDPAESLFLIVEGEVEVLLPTDTGQQKRLAVLSPGMSFGEMALLNDRTRSADVRTTRPSHLYQMFFNEISEGVRVKLLTQFAKQLAQKLGRETRELQHLD